MKHLRRHYLEEIAALLKTLSGFGGVWIQRSPPKQASYPSITLYAEEESATLETICEPPRLQSRMVSVVIKAWIKGSNDAEKAERDMDAIALQIEQVLENSFNAEDFFLVGTDFALDEEEPLIHSVTLTYQLAYFTTEFSPSTLL